jgi:hypothetical protein
MQGLQYAVAEGPCAICGLVVRGPVEACAGQVSCCTHRV